MVSFYWRWLKALLYKEVIQQQLERNEKSMEGLKVVEYDPSYAKRIAEMWQKSSEGWNGGHSDETEEKVLSTHEGTSNINTYLAVLKDEVLGYCAFSRYEEDEGALYIKLLNTRFDYHGFGIGKLLVQKSIQRTIELGWPRLDLYTWPGNTKSIPLYKKCGFFLENNSSSTHLMNFIPTVMQTEAVKDYFNYFDWYKDMKREITINPDGKQENGFDFFEYCWEKEHKKLRIEFERKGRGIRLIETDEYRISTHIPAQDLVFGKSNKIKYEIINKTDKPLKIALTGSNNKEVEFSLQRECIVLDKEVFEVDFYINKLDDEYNEFKTHPAIVTEILINDKKALFKHGIVPKFPGKISFIAEDVERFSGEKLTMYIDLESNLDEEGVFNFSLPKNKELEFNQSEFSIRLGVKEKVSIPVEAFLIKPTLYSATLEVKVDLTSGDSINFEKYVAVLLCGRDSALGGLVGNKYIITNGIYQLVFNKNFNEASMRNFRDRDSVAFIPPKLGKPYLEEYSNLPMVNVTWFYENSWMYLKGELISKEISGITLSNIFRLSRDGIIENYYEVTNTAKVERNEELWINQGIVYQLMGAHIPTGDKVVEFTEPGIENLGYFLDKNITENWIFRKTSLYTYSLIWPREYKLKFEDWFMYLEHELGKLSPGEKKTTKPIIVAMDTFNAWEELRNYALKSNKLGDMNRVNDLEICINGNNPFVGEYFNVGVKDNKTTNLGGEISIASNKDSLKKTSVVVDEESREAVISCLKAKDVKYDTITVKCNLNSMELNRKSQVFYTNKHQIKQDIIEDNGRNIYLVDNGVITLRVSPDFMAGVYSAQYKGREWLESSYPEAGPRTWFNPWIGGLQCIPRRRMFNGRDFIKEKVAAEFVEKIDNLGNRWSGIKTSLSITKDKDHEGITLKQYFLLLSGTPIILHSVEVEQNMKKYMDKIGFTYGANFLMDEDVKNTWVEVENFQGERTSYKSGTSEYDIYPDSSLLYGSNKTNTRIQIYTDYKKVHPWGFLNTKDCGNFSTTFLSANHGESKYLPNVYYIFTDERIDDKLLEDLKKISF